MTQNEIFQTMRLEKLRSRGQDKWLCSCPFAPWRHGKGTDFKPSMSITLEDGDLHFWCYSCGFSGDVYGVAIELHCRGWAGDIRALVCHSMSAAEGLPLKEMVGDADEFVQRPASKATVWPFPESWLANFDAWDHASDAVGYLEGREVSSVVADKMDLRYDVVEYRVGAPVRTFDGKLAGFHGRAVLEDADLKYRMYSFQGHTNPVVWLGENWVNLDEPVLVVESLFDLARVLEVAPNAICPLTAMFSQAKAARLSNAASIVSMFDNDDAGKMATARLQKGAVDFGPKKDFCSVRIPKGFKDPGEMPLDMLKERLNGKVRLN